MKNVILAVSAVAALSTAALADYTISFPGPQNLTGGTDFSTTTVPLTGTVTGVIIHYTYTNPGGFSYSSDMSFNVGPEQWGGFNRFINGATVDNGLIPGAIEDSVDQDLLSGILPLTTPLNLNGETVFVGYGNGYTGGSATMDNVTITLVGTVPTPGAAAVLGLGGLAMGRRRRA